MEVLAESTDEESAERHGYINDYESVYGGYEDEVDEYLAQDQDTVMYEGEEDYGYYH